jgi:hypothetical protein
MYSLRSFVMNYTYTHEISETTPAGSSLAS